MRILIVSQTPRTTARTSRLRRRTGAPSTPSPTSYVPIPSPAGGSSYQPSPSPSYAAPSPGNQMFLGRKISYFIAAAAGIGYSPMTPGSSQSPYHPAAGLGSHDILGSQDWYSPDIEVLIKESHEDTGLCGQIGVVRGVTPGMCSVFLHDEERWGAIILMGIYCRSDMYKLGSLVTTHKQSALLLLYLYLLLSLPGLSTSRLTTWPRWCPAGETR